MKRNASPLTSAILLTLMLPSTAALAQNFGPWSNTQAVASINTAAAAEGCPIEAPNGLSLYIASNRAGTQGKLDLYRAHRPSVDSGWGPVENLGSVNSPEFDYCPTPLQAGWLFFVSSRDTELDDDPTNDDCLPGPPAAPPPGGPAPGDMFLTRQHPVKGWLEPMHLGCYPHGPNTPGFEYSPSLVETEAGTELYFSSNGYPDSQSHDIYVSHVLDDGRVLPGVRVAELSSPAADVMPNVRRDGLEIVFSSNRGNEAFNQDIYVATRAHAGAPWSAPQRMDDPTINTPASETRASLSGDGTRLHFGRKLDVTDPGDVYLATRSKLRGPN
jgi:hypothetical protein